MTRIPAAEHGERLTRLEALIAEAGLDVFVVSAADSIHYLTGVVYEPIERPFFILVRPGRPAALLVPALEREHMKEAATVAARDVMTYWEYPAPPGQGWPERLREMLGDAARVGVEPTLSQEIAGELADRGLCTAPLVERLRLVKSPAEVAMIRRAARYADLGVEQLLAASYPGAMVAEGFAGTRAVTLRMAREVEGWDPAISKVIMATWAAPRSAQPHSIPRLDDRLGEGPHVALVLTRVNGYAAECERTYFTAPPSREVRAAFDVMMEARRRAFARVRPGVPCAELDAEINAFLKQEGHDAHRLHRTGHGFGLGNHEGPWVAEGSRDALAEDMVISIEPGIYLPGVGGVRHSDTVLVTARGAEPLTRQPVDLAALDLSQRRSPVARLRGVWIRRALGL